MNSPGRSGAALCRKAAQGRILGALALASVVATGCGSSAPREAATGQETAKRRLTVRNGLATEDTDGTMASILLVKPMSSRWGLIP